MKNRSDLNPLKKQVATIKMVDSGLTAQMANEVLNLEDDWTTEYGTYQSGGWKTLSLYNHSGVSTDTVIRDGIGFETSLLSQMPITKQFLNDLNLVLMSVRIAKLEPKAFLWEHRDYVELNERRKIRLHLPLITNSRCHLIISKKAVHMERGHLWMLDPTERHGVHNSGHEARYHLLIDAYVSKNLEKWMAQADLSEKNIFHLIPFTESQKRKALRAALGLAELGFYPSAESILLKQFHQFGTNEGTCYDLIIQMYDQLQLFEKVTFWQTNKEIHLGRFYGGSKPQSVAAAK